MTDHGWSWAGGFFAGEGWTSIRVNKASNSMSLALSVGQKDWEVLSWMEESCEGLGNINPPYYDGDVYHWQVFGVKAFYIMGMMWPYVGTLKQEQFVACLEKFLEHQDKKEFKIRRSAEHGTSQMYHKHKCRCGPCRNARSDEYQRMKERR